MIKKLPSSVISFRVDSSESAYYKELFKKIIIGDIQIDSELTQEISNMRKTIKKCVSYIDSFTQYMVDIYEGTKETTMEELNSKIEILNKNYEILLEL
ncbi:hypothetical protein ES702_07823 [subsurface metagenome]